MNIYNYLMKLMLIQYKCYFIVTVFITEKFYVTKYNEITIVLLNRRLHVVLLKVLFFLNPSALQQC